MGVPSCAVDDTSPENEPLHRALKLVMGERADIPTLSGVGARPSAPSHRGASYHAPHGNDLISFEDDGDATPMADGEESLPGVEPPEGDAGPTPLRGYRERIAVRNGMGYRLVRVAEIRWVEADDNNVRLHTASGAHAMRSTMRDMAEMLDPRQFLRIHRSIMVNLDHIEAIEAWGMGVFLFILSNGAKVSSSRTYRQSIREVIGC